MAKTELEVVLEQLEELIGEGVVDMDDALEVASLAGTAMRLGATAGDLVDAEAWREGPGEELLEEAWEELDLAPLVEAIDGCTGGDATEEEIEEAIFDFDDVVAAAIWCNCRSEVAAASAEVEANIRLIPDVFVEMAHYGIDLVRLPSVARDLVGVYGYWLALVDAGRVEE